MEVTKKKWLPWAIGGAILLAIGIVLYLRGRSSSSTTTAGIGASAGIPTGTTPTGSVVSTDLPTNSSYSYSQQDLLAQEQTTLAAIDQLLSGLTSSGAGTIPTPTQVQTSSATSSPSTASAASNPVAPSKSTLATIGDKVGEIVTGEPAGTITVPTSAQEPVANVPAISTWEAPANVPNLNVSAGETVAQIPWAGAGSGQTADVVGQGGATVVAPQGSSLYNALQGKAA